MHFLKLTYITGMKISNCLSLLSALFIWKYYHELRINVQLRAF